MSGKQEHSCQNGKVGTSRTDLDFLTSVPNSSTVEILGIPDTIKGHQSRV